jgi:geranylgeranyl diphosphate synthase type II
MDRLIAYMEERGRLVEEALESYLPRRKERPAPLHEAMRYSLFAGGKRLRPLLCLMSGELCGAEPQSCLAPAGALEMVHTYSLIHDDLPAMDDDDYRRGKLSCHKAYGEALAVLAGDALLTLAFQVLAKDAPADRAAELVRLLAAAAGHGGMVGGQVLDLEAEGALQQKKTAAAPKRKRQAESTSDVVSETPLERVEAIHRRKTGALITAAVEMGAATAGAAEPTRQILARYGRRIGLAFQIKDDILDIEGESEALGKSAGKDAASGKLTYPSVLGLEEARQLLRETVIDAKKLLEGFGEEALMLRLLADYIAERDR